MKIKFMIPIMLICLLILPMVMANSLGSVQQINDIKNKKYTIQEEGIYLNNIKQVAKKDAEIWIDKKVGDTYHVDSLVDDVLVDVKLFYDIQPDEIDYRSHNGKYQQIYTYNDWTWEDKLGCKEEEYCGGYIILEVTLEEGQGSNTFVGAISGATWQDDGVTITLVENTDYTSSGDQFTIINQDYAWVGVNTSWDYTSKTYYGMGDNWFSGPLSDFASWIAVIVVVIGAGIVLTIVLNNFSNKKVGV